MNKVGLSFIMISLLGCQKMSSVGGAQDLPWHEGSLTADPNMVALSEKPETNPPLLWEKNRPEAKDWSRFVRDLIAKESLQTLDKSSDAEVFCPNYRSLNYFQRVSVWAQAIAAISKYESGFNPLNRTPESTMGIDPVTRQPVMSEGLLQLSYQDTKWAKFCPFEWDKDKHLSPKDPRRSILDPYKNLQCGIRILTNQVKRTGRVFLEKGVYWSVLKIRGRYQKIAEITGATKTLGFCRAPASTVNWASR